MSNIFIGAEMCEHNDTLTQPHSSRIKKMWSINIALPTNNPNTISADYATQSYYAKERASLQEAIFCLDKINRISTNSVETKENVGFHHLRELKKPVVQCFKLINVA